MEYSCIYLTTSAYSGWEVLNMERGETVRVTEYGGRQIDRRVVVCLDHTVVVCNEEEYLRAIREQREPDGVGFPRENVRLAPKR
jgi:hypothetical protein